MDEEMGESIDLTFNAVELDLDYEFDAARYFDFTRDDSIAEACEAELWFESVGSYPPSPFVTRLVLREDILQETVNTSPESKHLVNKTFPNGDVRNRFGQDFSLIEMTDGVSSKAKTKTSVKPSFSRISTLMKPTASQLAKQNRPCKVGDLRVQKLLVDSRKKEKSLNNPFGIECQAAKRQKLEGGLLHKFTDAKQQSDLVHKAPKRVGTTDGNSAFAKLKLTIPREPDLETAHRAEKIRPKVTAKPQSATSTILRFKALPLNRKILEAPSLLQAKRSIPRLLEFQEFHLKTSERALQHPYAESSSLVSGSNTDKVLHKPSADIIAESANRESKRFADASRQGGRESFHNFKARPLNRKIFSSKGDIGVLRNSKKETTVPKEFNLNTEKRRQHNPPIELFKKLSLTELQPNAVSQLKLPQPSCIPPEGSKENRFSSFQREHETKPLVKEGSSRFGEKQRRYGKDRKITEVCSLSSMRRKSLGIR